MFLCTHWQHNPAKNRRKVLSVLLQTSVCAHSIQSCCFGVQSCIGKKRFWAGFGLNSDLRSSLIFLLWLLTSHGHCTLCPLTSLPFHPLCPLPFAPLCPLPPMPFSPSLHLLFDPLRHCALGPLCPLPLVPFAPSPIDSYKAFSPSVCSTVAAWTLS